MPWFIVLWTYERSNQEMSLLSQNTSDQRKICEADMLDQIVLFAKGNINLIATCPDIDKYHRADHQQGSSWLQDHDRKLNLQITDHC